MESKRKNDLEDQDEKDLKKYAEQFSIECRTLITAGAKFRERKPTRETIGRILSIASIYEAQHKRHTVEEEITFIQQHFLN